VTKLALVRASPNVTDGSSASGDLELKADVCIIGTGAGGAVTAAVLAEAGFDVLMIEEGGYYTSNDFTMRERDTTPRLYQEGGTRTTKDLAISILQGKAVGGTTVVNWTTSFRTPEDVIQTWHDKHAVKGFAYADLVPHWDAIEKRLAIAKVDVASMNANNRKLYDGCKALGWEVDTLKRNVYACLQTGFCGLGCPVNAKRSMLVTTIPDAIDAGARLVFRVRADRFVTKGNTVATLEGTLLDGEGIKPTGKKLTVTAKRFVTSCGALNSPALFLRSGIDDAPVGVRTFLHPVIGSAGIYDEDIYPYRGAPQSAASHHFAHPEGLAPSERWEGGVGFFLEAVPWYPSLSSGASPSFGAEHLAFVKRVKNTATHIALVIDGFHDDLAGGRVTLRPSGMPLLDYPITERLWSTFRFAQKKLAEMQLASGAKEVFSLHDPALHMTSKADIDRVIDAAPFDVGRLPVFTAHQMGGLAMGDDPSRSVVRSEDLRHHRIENLYVIDGSVFPTSLGVNPQESIYGLARLMATRLAARK
jgi:choline dehydrogenase-like flavoprotein